MHRNRTTTGLLLAGLLGLLLAGFGIFASPWPWVVVLALGAVRSPVARLLAGRRAADAERLEDMRHAREAMDAAGVGLQRQVLKWEERICGTLTPEEAREVRASHNRIVQDMEALRTLVEEVAKEQRARALAAPFSEVG